MVKATKSIFICVAKPALQKLDKLKISDISRVSRALKKSWSIASSSKWKASNPALGQCGVTALVVQDCLGGDILKTKIEKGEAGGLWHYYNLISNKPIDFTFSQFDDPIHYENLPSNRDEAFLDTNAQQYEYLSSAIKNHLQHAEP